MEAYLAHERMAGDKKMSELEPLYKKALAGCTKEKFILIDVAGEIDKAKSRSDWDEIMQKIFREDKA